MNDQQNFSVDGGRDSHLLVGSGWGLKSRVERRFAPGTFASLVKVKVPKLAQTKLCNMDVGQGSGTYAVEAVLQTSSPREGGRVLILANGAYGRRMARICEVLPACLPELGSLSFLFASLTGDLSGVLITCAES